MADNPYRHLPAVNDLLQQPALQALAGSHAHELIVAVVRTEVAELRERLGKGEAVDGLAEPAALAQRVVARLGHELTPKLRAVINGTGIVLHTNIGRAPVAEEAARAAYDAARGYLNLELDLETGKRSSRQVAIRDWLCRLTGAESATAVNNNAAATVIVLRAICAGKEAIISRGELVEIGGSFRIPEIMGVSGAVLREVGSTNITRIGDFERAVGPNTGALMRVHCSNYRITGHTEAASLEELVALGKKHNLPVIDDIGSGALVDFSHFGFVGEPLARDSVAAGADLVLFSGDKLLGGPQAGVIAGRKDLVARIEKDPLMRAFRLDKMTLAALETTLRLYLDPDRAVEQLPVLRMLRATLTDLCHRAKELATRLRALPGVSNASVSEETAYVGGGTLPDQSMKTWVVEVAATDVSDQELAYRLRKGAPAVLGRLSEGMVVLDLRTIFPDQETLVVEAVRAAVAKS